MAPHCEKLASEALTYGSHSCYTANSLVFEMTYNVSMGTLNPTIPYPLATEYTLCMLQHIHKGEKNVISYRASLLNQFIYIDRTRVSTLLQAVEAAMAAWWASRSTAVIALAWRRWNSRLTALPRQTMLLLYSTIARMARRLQHQYFVSVWKCYFYFFVNQLQ